MLVKYQRGPVRRNAVELLLLGYKMDLGLPRLSCHRDRLSYYLVWKCKRGLVHLQEIKVLNLTLIFPDVHAVRLHAVRCHISHLLVLNEMRRLIHLLVCSGSLSRISWIALGLDRVLGYSKELLLWLSSVLKRRLMWIWILPCRALSWRALAWSCRLAAFRCYRLALTSASNSFSARFPTGKIHL